MNSELIVALDVATSQAMPGIVDGLPEAIRWYKVGLELFAAEGPDALACLRERGKQVFLDLKLNDIPHTVARAVKAAARHKINLLTVHANGGPDMLAAAAEAAMTFGAERPKLVAVTALTSLGQTDIERMGVRLPIADYIERLGEMAIAAGMDGLVCSVHEVARFRERLGPDPILITPGIRPAGRQGGKQADAGGAPASPDDQKRVATPAMAVKGGANYLVVGRPIVKAENPNLAAQGILREMAAAGER